MENIVIKPRMNPMRTPVTGGPYNAATMTDNIRGTDNSSRGRTIFAGLITDPED